MILGIGIDILSLPRLDALLRRRTALRLAERICTARELAAFRKIAHEDEETLRARQARFLSSRWAAKEAAFKALPPRSLASWRDLELWHAHASAPSSGRTGPPTLALVSGPLFDTMRARKRAREGARMEALGAGFVGAMFAEAEAARGGRGVGEEEGEGGGEPLAHPQLGGRAAMLAAAAAAVHGRAPRLERAAQEEVEVTEEDGDDEGCGVSLLTTISHDAGVVVAAVVAQRE